jgi:hypothetical protein
MDASPVKHWTFNTFAIAGFSSSALAVTLLVVNALSANRYVAILLPVAVVALIVGGFMSVRAHLLWYRGRSNTFRPFR